MILLIVLTKRGTQFKGYCNIHNPVQIGPYKEEGKKLKL